MTPEQMISHCKQQQELQGSADAMVTFVLPGISRNETRKLAGRHGPVGVVVGTRGGNSVVSFKADEVLKYIAK